MVSEKYKTLRRGIANLPTFFGSEHAPALSISSHLFSYSIPSSRALQAIPALRELQRRIIPTRRKAHETVCHHLLLTFDSHRFTLRQQQVVG